MGSAVRAAVTCCVMVAAAGEVEQALDDFVDTIAHVGRVSGHSALSEFDSRAPHYGSAQTGNDVRLCCCAPQRALRIR